MASYNKNYTVFVNGTELGSPAAKNTFFSPKSWKNFLAYLRSSVATTNAKLMNCDFMHLMARVK